MFLSVDAPHFVRPLSVDGRLGCFHFLATVKSAAVDIEEPVFV